MNNNRDKFNNNNNDDNALIKKVAQLSSQTRYLSNKVNQLNDSINDIKTNNEERDDNNVFGFNLSDDLDNKTSIICRSILLGALMIATVITVIFAPHDTILLLLHHQLLAWLTLVIVALIFC